MRRAVIFDLDGTLTVGILNFDNIRAEIGLPDGPILEALADMDRKRRARAQAILYRHERRAAAESMLQDGAEETIATLRLKGWAVGVVTRNARCWTEQTLKRHGLIVDGLRCREDGGIKPSPDGILSLCQAFDADPKTSWMVGDYLFDIQAGKRAGLKTVLMIGNRPEPDYAHQADFVIRRLPALLDIVGP